MIRAHQLGLFGDDERPLYDNEEETIQAAFEAFDRAYPHIYDLFKRIAKRRRKAGFRHYSSKAIFEDIRLHYIRARAEKFMPTK